MQTIDALGMESCLTCYGVTDDLQALETPLSCTIHDIPFVSVPGRSDLYEMGGNPSSRVRCRGRVVPYVPRCVHPLGPLEVPFMRPLLQGTYFRPTKTRTQVKYLRSLRRGYQRHIWLNRNAANNTTKCSHGFAGCPRFAPVLWGLTLRLRSGQALGRGTLFQVRHLFSFPDPARSTAIQSNQCLPRGRCET